MAGGRLRDPHRAPGGHGYPAIEIKVNYLWPVTRESGMLTCVGRVTKPGRRVTFAEAEATDDTGRTVATASSTLIVFPIGPGDGHARR